MNRRRSLLLGALTMLFVPLWLVGLISDFADWDEESLDQLLLGQMVGVFFLTGVLIVRHRPAHRMGWLFIAIGVYGAIGGLLDLFDPIWSQVLWSWFLFLGLVLVFVPLWFPTGSPPTPRWRWVEWLGGLALITFMLLGTFREQVCVLYRQGDCREFVPNPIGIPGVPDPEYGGGVSEVVGGLLVLAMVGAVASLVVRFWRSGGVERQQLKWIAFAFALLLGWILVVDILLSERFGMQVPFSLTIIPMLLFLFLPVSAGIAILRYRLYDIDLVINRTLVYGSLTALLGLVYVAGVVGLPRLLPLGEDNDLVVAGSTLAVAALFSPLRRGIQALWTAASTGAATTPAARWRPSRPGSGRKWTLRRSYATSREWSETPSSPPRWRCG